MRAHLWGETCGENNTCKNERDNKRKKSEQGSEMEKKRCGEHELKREREIEKGRW